MMSRVTPKYPRAEVQQAAARNAQRLRRTLPCIGTAWLERSINTEEQAFDLGQSPVFLQRISRRPLPGQRKLI